MPFSTSRAAVSRCLLALLIVVLAGAVLSAPADARKKGKSASKQQQFKVQKQRGRAGVWKGAAGGRAALRGTTIGINAGGGLFRGDAAQTASRVAAVAQTGRASSASTLRGRGSSRRRRCLGFPRYGVGPVSTVQ